MPFPLLISLREPLLELRSALPAPAARGRTTGHSLQCHCRLAAWPARLLPSWVCKAVIAGCVRADTSRVSVLRVLQ